jgi:hypothetical protein
MQKFFEKTKHLIKIKKEILKEKINSAKDLEYFFMEKFQFLLNSNTNLDTDEKLRNYLNNYLKLEVGDEKDKKNISIIEEESIILGQNLFNDINQVKEKIINKINLVNIKQNYIKDMENNLEIKYNELNLVQKNIFDGLIMKNINTKEKKNKEKNKDKENCYGDWIRNTNSINNYSKDTISNNENNNNKINSGEIESEILHEENSSFRKSDSACETNYKNSTNNLLGEISMVFEKLKENNFFDKICITETQDEKAYNIKLSPIPINNSFFYKNSITEPKLLEEFRLNENNNNYNDYYNDNYNNENENESKVSFFNEGLSIGNEKR